MLTRSVAKGLYWRVPCSSNRLVLDVILRNIQYENENDNDTEGFWPINGISLLLVFKTPLFVVGVICGVCRRRGSMQHAVSQKRIFCRTNPPWSCLLSPIYPGFDHKRAHIYFGSWPDALAENKEHICVGTLFFRQICPNYIRKPISSS